MSSISLNQKKKIFKLFKKFKSKEDIIKKIISIKINNNYITKKQASSIYKKCKNMLIKYNNSYKFKNNEYIRRKKNNKY